MRSVARPRCLTLTTVAQANGTGLLAATLSGEAGPATRRANAKTPPRPSVRRYARTAGPRRSRQPGSRRRWSRCSWPGSNPGWDGCQREPYSARKSRDGARVLPSAQSKQPQRCDSPRAADSQRHCSPAAAGTEVGRRGCLLRDDGARWSLTIRHDGLEATAGSGTSGR